MRTPAAVWRRLRRGGAGVALGGLIGLVSPDAALAQCAMCRSALASAEGQQLIEAFRSGIAFLLAAPFLVFGVVATLAVRSASRRRPTPPPPEGLAS